MTESCLYQYLFQFQFFYDDPDDNKFVECAIAASAFGIITEDNDFKIFSVINFPQVKVLSMAALW